MTTLLQLRAAYHNQINASFNKQDRFTIDKAKQRSKRVLPRGQCYVRLLKLELARDFP